MEQLKSKIKSLRTELSVQIDTLKALDVEGICNCNRDNASKVGMECYMMLGKVLAFLGEPNPYESKEITDIVDWHKEEIEKSSDIEIHVVKKLRSDIQALLASNSFNHLLDITTSGGSGVNFNDRSWFFVMTALTDLMKMKMWLGMYLRDLYIDESEEQKAERLDIEKEELKKSTEPAEVTDDEITEEIEKMKTYLTEKEIHFHPALGYKKLKVLYEEAIAKPE